MCEQLEKRFERFQTQAKRTAREAEVAAALAARADTRATGKIRWDDKLPSVNKLAKTVANKAEDALKSANALNPGNNKAGKVCKWAKKGNMARVQPTEGSKANEILPVEPDKAKANQKLRIQRG